MMRRSLSAAEERSLFKCVGSRASLEARRDHAWMRALRFSGCRVGEFSAVSVSAALMALQRRHLFLPRETRKGKRRDHDVYVTAELRRALQDLMRVREEQTGIRTADLPRNAPLVVNRYGARLSIRSYQLRLEYWVKEAGLELDVTPHWFRHTRAMRIMRDSQAADPRGIVQVALGHADIKSSGIYTAPTREDVEAALEAADGTPRIRKRQAARIFRSQCEQVGA